MKNECGKVMSALLFSQVNCSLRELIIIGQDGSVFNEKEFATGPDYRGDTTSVK